MRPAGEFDVFTCGLDGVNLIEASAGTGKTWNICGLYLRLLLERDLDVRRILVVTFTNAATAELRERIRGRIVETLAWLAGGAAAADDPFVGELVRAVEQHTGMARERIAPRLDEALQYFDEAAIFTIHGFCQRALAEVAFSAGLPFALTLVTDDTEMMTQVVHDFWRRRVAAADCPPALAAYLESVEDTPERYVEVLKRSLARPLAHSRWPAALAGISVDDKPLAAARAAARELWLAQRDAILAAVVAGLPGLNKATYKPATIERAAAAWDAHFRSAEPFAALDADAKPQILSATMLKKRTNKGQVTPAHPFFAAADALLEARDALDALLALARLALLRELVEVAGPELRRRKRERRVIAFDDMLYNLHAALADGAHPALAATLRERYPVALIDEFQDTDPLQFAIFDRIYRTGGAPAFLVGDPKQAIYSFRHADLHAYLRACRTVAATFTLGANQRSTPGLIEALNALFGANRSAFMLDGLAYRRVGPGRKPRPAFADATLPRADLQAWLLPATPEATPVPKATAKALAAQATAAEIARLLAEGAQGRITLGGRALRAADIAVLVRTHAQGTELKRELAALGIGSVELSQQSVFQTPDAEEVERVLLAVSQPSRDALLRAALATEMIGCDASAIAGIAADEALLTGWLERFAGYRELWLRSGVGVMYRRLMSDVGASARMLGRVDGERRLTNLLHLGELIHQAAQIHESPDALLRWLASRRREASADDAVQLRLESDRNLVQIVTIHKAKGLEFPIVFCPFLWDGYLRRPGREGDALLYHDAHGDAVIDFRLDEEIGGEQSAIAQAMRLEQAAEDLRLVYVALTRAVYRCYVIGGTYAANGAQGSTKDACRSLLNWLVAGDSETPIGWLDGTRTPADIAAAWQGLAARAAPHLGVAPLPVRAGTRLELASPEPESLAALPPPRSIPNAWRIGSFTGLVSDAHSEAAASDHDARIEYAAPRSAAPPPDLAPDDILRFPRGPSAGDCLHAIFERADFTEPNGWRAAIDRGLYEHPQILPGVRAAEQPALLARMASRMLGDVLRTRLPAGIVLGSIPASRRLTELEFKIPSPRLSATALNAALRRLGYAMPRLGFRDLEGYLNGYIDLVFEHEGRYYVLDWKSNHLGWSAGDYGPAALAQAMAEHSYALQYLLYALAVDRYLRRRVAGYAHETHFGGVLYLFVRGVRPGWIGVDGAPTGVYFDRLSAATLAQLDALFAGERATALR